MAFRRGSLLEYGGLKPILPFLGERSDAACRVVIQPSRFPPRRPYGFHNDAAREGVRRMVRAGTRYARHRPYQERNSQSRKLIER